jgi:hypothetical protein
MKQYRKRSFLLLSLFILSAILPAVLVNSSIDVKSSTAKIYLEDIFDLNDDKIQDELLKYVGKKGESIIDAVVLFDHKINEMDKFRLAQIGARISNDVWDLGQRILVTTHSDNLDLIAKLPGVSLISLAEKRTIIIVIEGDDYSDLNLLKQFDGSMIFWGIGCAYVPYYTGIENDIARLGDYSIIADMTDVKFYPDSSAEKTKEIVYSVATADTADYINATALWDEGYEGSTVKVGIMDTGINTDHNDIAGRVDDAQSFVYTIYGLPEDDPTTTDFDGHGSHVTGIVAGDGTNDPANIGMAPDTNIYFAKIGNPSTTLCSLAALNWLVEDMEVDVVNYSYGGDDEVGMGALEAAFSNAMKNKNVVCVTSAGNGGYEGFYSISSPASDDIISVGNLDTTGDPFEIAQTSSKGPTVDGHMKPDILAPGTDIMSLLGGGQGYESRGGTSMASPHVVGGIALLIDACNDNGISYNPGLLKAAIMNTATKLPSDNILAETLGYIDVGQAWHYIKHASEVSGYPLIGACNPYKLPLPFWETIIQGQIVEQFFTCVSPYKTSLSLEISGTAAPLMTYELYQLHYTTLFRLVINVTEDTPLGIYTGQVSFKYSTNVLDTADIEFEVVAGSGKRMLLNFRTTKDKENHENFGRYSGFINDAYSSGYAICEENVYLDSGVLNQYDAVWLPDPFNYYYPEAYNYTIDVIDTWKPWTANEKTALTTYVENGGSVFINFNGLHEEIDEDFGPLVEGSNVSVINEWISQWGITAAEALYTGSTQLVNMKGISALAAGVDSINHLGTNLTVSGDAISLTEETDGTELNTVAIYLHDSGGRVIVMSTNRPLDPIGYLNDYHDDETQNDILGQNLIRWVTAEHRIRLQNITAADKTITLRYEYLAGPGADFSGHVILPDTSQVDLVWSEVETDIWETSYSRAKKGTYEFFVECGTTGEDEFDYIKYVYGSAGGLGLESVYVVLISAFGLAGWFLIQKKRKLKQVD